MSNTSAPTAERHAHFERALHHDPPLTPHGVLFRHPALIWVVIATSAVLAILAAYDEGSVLLTWDEPIQRWVEDNRTDRLETIFRSFSRMGSNIVIFGSFAVIVIWVATQCRTLALSLTVAVLVRPGFEFLIKELVDRDRPDLERLVPGVGPSHPSGHVLAAVTLWGLLPPLVATVTSKHWVWWATTVVSGVLIAGISASRMYLGVHWFSDIVQGLLLGWLYLTVIESLFAHHHHGRHCSGADAAPHHRFPRRPDWRWHHER